MRSSPKRARDPKPAKAAFAPELELTAQPPPPLGGGTATQTASTPPAARTHSKPGPQLEPTPQMREQSSSPSGPTGWQKPLMHSLESAQAEPSSPAVPGAQTLVSGATSAQEKLVGQSPSALQKLVHQRSSPRAAQKRPLAQSPLTLQGLPESPRSPTAQTPLSPVVRQW
jgi:hypothetical protein